MKHIFYMVLGMLCLKASAQTFDKKRFDSLSVEFDNGGLAFSEFPWMVKKAEQFGQPDRAKRMADFYTVSLLKNIDSIGYRKQDLQLVMDYIHSSKTPGFDLLLHKPEKVDVTLQVDGAARARVDYVIAREELDAKLWKDGKPLVVSPDWTSYGKNIARKYGKGYVEKPMLGAKVRWYLSQKDDQNYIKYQLELLERYGMETDGYRALAWNNFLFNEVFKKSVDQSQLSRALSLAKQLIDKNPSTASVMDTYANLLYKLGRNEEALKWQKKAFELNPADRDIREAYEKMQTGKATW